MHNLILSFQKWLRFWRWVVLQFLQDRCLTRAAGLTYTSLLALVPLMVVAFSLFRLSPFFDSISGDIQSFVFNNFVPSTGQVVQQYLNKFTTQAVQLPVMSFLFLIVTAIMMMISIEGTLNDIWQVTYRRRLTGSILLYWAMLTLGPLLLGAGLFISTYLTSLQWFAQVTPRIQQVDLFLPFIFTVLSFGLLYMVVPHCTVKFRHAAAGAMIAAILFEISKHIFAFYVVFFPTYAKLYGALATVPLFLIWVYLSWNIFLFGAEVVNGLRLSQAERSVEQTYPLVLAYRVIGHLWQAQQNGGALSLPELLRSEQHSSVQVMKKVLERLLAERLIYSFGEDSYVLSCDLHQLTFHQFYLKVQWYLPEQANELVNDAWLQGLNQVLSQVHQGHQQSMNVSMANLYGSGEPAQNIGDR